MQLTARQQEVLDFIKSFIKENQYAPTRREIAVGLGFSSENSSQAHLTALHKKGAIEVVKGTQRGIRIND